MLFCIYCTWMYVLLLLLHLLHFVFRPVAFFRFARSNFFVIDDSHHISSRLSHWYSRHRCMYIVVCRGRTKRNNDETCEGCQSIAWKWSTHGYDRASQVRDSMGSALRGLGRVVFRAVLDCRRISARNMLVIDGSSF